MIQSFKITNMLAKQGNKQLNNEFEVYKNRFFFFLLYNFIHVSLNIGKKGGA